MDKTSPEFVGPVRHQGQRTEQDKSVSTVHFLAGSNDIRMLRPSCIVPGTPGYIDDTNAKNTTGSHHIMPISQGDIDSCSTLQGGTKTAGDLAPTHRGGVFGTLHAEMRGCLCRLNLSRGGQQSNGLVNKTRSYNPRLMVCQTTMITRGST